MSIPAVHPRPILRFGLIGVDSSHAVAFTRLLGEGNGGDVTGATITAAWKAPTSWDLAPSRERNDDLAHEVAELGVPFLDTPEDVAQHCDALLILTADPRGHSHLVTRLAPHGLPIYVLSRFALTVAEASEMFDAAREHGSLLLAGSPKRFDPGFQNALTAGRASQVGLDGPLPTQPCLPVLAWYGVHLIDLAVAALGADWTDIRRKGEDFLLTWADGRTARLSGSSTWHERTHVTLAFEDGSRSVVDVIARPTLHVGLLNAIIRACRSGTPTVPEAEVMACVRILESSHSLIDPGTVRGNGEHG